MTFYNHDIRSTGPAWLGLSKMYSSRTQCLTQPGDIIQLPHNLKRCFDIVHKHYERCGLYTTKNVIWDTQLKFIKDYSNFKFSYFFYGDIELRHKGDETLYKVSKQLNSKNSFYKLLTKLSIPTPESIEANTNDKIEVAENFFPLYLKPDVSLSGIGINRCENINELKNNIAKLPKNIEIQLQKEISAISFVNLQYFLADDKIEKVAVSEQKLDGNRHAGNTSPSRFTPWYIVDDLAKYIRDMGYRGIIGFDVAVELENDNVKYSVLECNPRYNSSSYYALLAKKLDLYNWTTITLKTKYKSLSCIDLEGIEYSNETKKGVIHVNWGAILHNAPQFMIVGDENQQQELINELTKRIENPKIKDISPIQNTWDDELLLDYNEIEDVTSGTWKNMADKKFKFQKTNFNLSEIVPGDLYFCLDENRTDLEVAKNISKAIEKGALGAVVSSGRVDFRNIPVLEVADVSKALYDVALASSLVFDGTKVVVFGSHGKTGFKNQLKHLIKNDFNVYANKTSANLRRPVWRSVSSLTKNTDLTIIEVAIPIDGMGRRRSMLIRPNFCVFTGAGPEHLSSHGSMEQLIVNKSEIVIHMAQDGSCIVNGDDAYSSQMISEIKKRNTRCKIYTFGSDSKNDAYVVEKKFIDNCKWLVTANILGETISYEIPLLENYAPVASTSVLLLSKLLGSDLNSIVSNYLEYKNFFSSGNLYDIKLNNINFLLYDQSSRGELKGFESTIELANRMDNKKGRKILITTEIINFEDNPNYDLDKEFYSNLINESDIDILYTTLNFSKHDFNLTKKFDKNIYFESSSKLYEELILELKDGDMVFLRGVEDGKLNLMVEKILNASKKKLGFTKIY